MATLTSLGLSDKPETSGGVLQVHQYAPRCVLHLTKAGRLLPVAVELCLPHEKPLVITSNDDPLRWRLAKTHFLTAHAGHHQLISHWCATFMCPSCSTAAECSESDLTRS